MTGAGTIPFDPARLTELGRLAAEVRAMSAPPMLEHPVVVDDKGYAWIQFKGIADGEPIGSYLHTGWRLVWAPLIQLDAVMLALWGGPSAESGFEEEAVAAVLTREQLRRHIADLQAIEAAL